MVKVYAGPIVSTIQGSIGPVTYFNTLGRLVARARVRPNQHLTSKRIASRNSWKLLMRWWTGWKPWSGASWNRTSFPAMHGVNRFIQLNRPSLPSVSYAYPADPNGYPPFDWGRCLIGDAWYPYVWGDWTTWPLAQAVFVNQCSTAPHVYRDWYRIPPQVLHYSGSPAELDDIIVAGYSPTHEGYTRLYHCQVQLAKVSDLPILSSPPF